LNTQPVRARIMAAAAVAALLLTGCSGGDADTSSPDEATASSSKTDESSGADAKKDGGYAYGTDREQITAAIEAAFSTQGGQARWEGDTLVISLNEGDADEDMAGFVECRSLSHLLQAGDESVIEYPNGRVSCSDVLG